MDMTDWAGRRRPRDQMLEDLIADVFGEGSNGVREIDDGIYRSSGMQGLGNPLLAQAMKLEEYLGPT